MFECWLIYFLHQRELETRSQTVRLDGHGNPQPHPSASLLSPWRSPGFLPPHKPFFPPPSTDCCAGVWLSPDDGPMRGQPHLLDPSQLFSGCDWQRTKRQWILWDAVLCHYQLFMSFWSSTYQSNKPRLRQTLNWNLDDRRDSPFTALGFSLFRQGKFSERLGRCLKQGGSAQPSLGGMCYSCLCGRLHSHGNHISPLLFLKSTCLWEYHSDKKKKWCSLLLLWRSAKSAPPAAWSFWLLRRQPARWRWVGERSEGGWQARGMEGMRGLLPGSGLTWEIRPRHMWGELHHH